MSELLTNHFDKPNKKPSMDLRTRVCIWIILLGVSNFFAYAIGYSIVGGESIHGKITEDPATAKRHYYLATSDQEPRKVHRDEFVYIGIHSISIWVTVAAIILSMLTLAKDHIADSLRSAAIRGRTLCTIVAILVSMGMGGLTFLYISHFMDHFKNPPSEITSVQTTTSADKTNNTPQAPTSPE